MPESREETRFGSAAVLAPFSALSIIFLFRPVLAVKISKDRGSYRI